MNCLLCYAEGVPQHDGGTSDLSTRSALKSTAAEEEASVTAATNLSTTLSCARADACLELGQNIISLTCPSSSVPSSALYIAAVASFVVAP